MSEKEKGFTVVEIAIVLMVAGSLLAFLGSALLKYQQERRIALTEYRLEKIHTAIGVYLNKRKKLPCPAARNAFPRNGATAGSPMFGREVRSTVAGATVTLSSNCAGGGVAGTRLVPGTRTAASQVRVGSVPVRNLDLEDDMMVDGWGNRFTYAVTASQATTGSYVDGEGQISIVGIAGNNVLGTSGAGRADYVVISHGADQRGAQNIMFGNVPVPCNGGGLQTENCVNEGAVDSDAVFMDTMHRYDNNGRSLYDDYIIYSAPSATTEDIPSGAVVPFNLRYCPDGWAPMEEARGRFIMSVGNFTRTAKEPFNMQATDIPIDFPVGQTEGTNYEQLIELNIPPYVALLYCRKS